VKNDTRTKDVVKKYNVSVFTVCEQLRKDYLSAKPREETQETEGREKACPNIRKEFRDFGLNYDFWTLKLIANILILHIPLYSKYSIFI
jgi:hypothetical protein